MKNDFDSIAFDRAERSFLGRVYQWMAAGLALTGFVALAVASNPAFLRALSGGLFFLLMIVEIGLVIWLSARIQHLSMGAALTGFLVYSALNGMTLSFLFAVYTGASIALTFFVTAGTFAGVSLFGALTKTDLGSMRGYLFMGLIGVILASVVNIFLHSSALYWILTYAGLAVFIGLTAYDTQRLKALQRSGASDQVAILGALTLYLDFINMFVLLLRIFGRRR